MLLKHIIGIILIGTLYNSDAQFDERFYFPRKDVVYPDSINIKEFPLFVESDTIFIQRIKPLVPTKNFTILYFHGSGGNSSNYISLILPLIQNGYEIYMVDFRGYGHSSGKPTHLNIEKDAQIILDTIMKRSIDPIILYGASIGTQIATKLAAENESKIYSLILDCPMSSFTDIAVHSTPEPSRAIVQQIVTSPYSAKEDIRKIKKLPILILHGANDKSIPFEQGKTVFDNAISINKKWWVYEGDHLEAPRPFTEEYLKQINLLLQN